MKEYIPLLQTLVWPVFVAYIIWVSRSKFLDLIDAVRLRIEQGSSFEAGTTGVKIGESQPRLAPTAATRPTDQTNPGFYVVHKARKSANVSRATGEQKYRLSIYVECDPDLDLAAIDRVVYHLHPTFHDPVRIVKDVDSWFELVTEAWGQFNLEAEIFLKNITRYTHQSGALFELLSGHTMIVTAIKAKLNRCRKRLVWHLSWQRRLLIAFA